MVGLIFPCNLKFAPYVQYYMDALKEEKIPFETISWDKKDLSEDTDHAFHFPCNDWDRRKRLFGHFRFSRFVKKIVSRQKYDRLVVFTVAPLLFLTPYLSRKYNKRFVLDVRDASPFVSVFPNWFRRMAGRAQQIVVSSPNFLNWIPYKAILSHNCSVDTLRKYQNDATPQGNTLPIRFACAGMLNEAAINIRFIDAAKNDDLFEHWYIGPVNEGKQHLIDHVQTNGYQNVHFMGTYNKEDIVSIYRDHADFVNIIRRKCVVNRDALPNKMYDAVVSGKPCIVLHHNEAVARLVDKYHLGLVVTQDVLDHPQTKLLPLCEAFSYEKFAAGRLEFIEDILKDQYRFNEVIKALGGVT